MLLKEEGFYTMVTRVISIAMIVLGAVGLVVTGVVFSAATNQVESIDQTLQVADLTLQDTSDTLATTSQSITELVNDVNSTAVTISEGLGGIENYLVDTGTNIHLIKDELSLPETIENISSLRYNLQSSEIPLNDEMLANLREQISNSEMALNSAEVMELNNFLSGTGDVPPSLLTTKLEQYTGYYAIPAVKAVIQELDAAGIEFIRDNGWLKISGSNLVEASDILERNMGMDMSLLRNSGQQLADQNMVTGVNQDQPLQNIADGLNFWEQQKGLLVQNIEILEKDTKLVSQQIPVIATNLSKAEDALILADTNIDNTGQALIDLGKQFNALNENIFEATQNINNITIAEGLTTISKNLTEMKISQATNLISTLIRGIMGLMAIGSILFILAGVGLLLMDLNVKKGNITTNVAPSVSA